MDFYAWIYHNLDLVFENCGLFCVHFSKLWTFTRRFLNIWPSVLKIVDFSAYIFQNYGLLHVNFSKFGPHFWKLGTFTCQFEKYGLLCVNLVKLWTFRCEFLIIWTSCLKIWTSCWKIVDFYTLILQNIDLICEKCGLLRANFNLVFENCGLFIRVSLKILDFYA